MTITLHEIGMTEINAIFEEIQEELLNLEESTFNIDLKEVEKIELCGVQLFLSLKKYCDSSSITLNLQNINYENLQDTIDTYHLKEKLELSL
jgi:ABC-type transporter Mla MlaB component